MVSTQTTAQFEFQTTAAADLFHPPPQPEVLTHRGRSHAQSRYIALDGPLPVSPWRRCSGARIGKTSFSRRRIPASSTHLPPAQLPPRRRCRVGAIGRLRNVVDCGGNNECLWEEAGNLTDEFHNADFQNTRQDIDQRQMTDDNPTVPYTSVTQQRGFVRDAIAAARTYTPTATADIGELYMALGFLEMSLGENLLQRNSARPYDERGCQLRSAAHQCAGAGQRVSASRQCARGSDWDGCQ